jgi:hypothetical protein
MPDCGTATKVVDVVLLLVSVIRYSVALVMQLPAKLAASAGNATTTRANALPSNVTHDRPALIVRNLQACTTANIVFSFHADMVRALRLVGCGGSARLWRSAT